MVSGLTILQAGVTNKAATEETEGWSCRNPCSICSTCMSMLLCLSLESCVEGHALEFMLLVCQEALSVEARGELCPIDARRMKS